MKRCAQLRRLSLEHQTALSLAVRLKRAAETEPDEALTPWLQQMQTCWRDELLPHFELEETRLLPALTKAGLAPLAERTLTEHRELGALACDSALPPRDRIARFAALLNAHVRFEERELFETAQRTLPEAVLNSIHSG